MNDYLTPKEIAEKLSINIYTVLRFIKNGDLESVNIGSEKSPRHRVSVESYKKFIEKRTSKNI